MNGKVNDVIVWNEGGITLMRPVTDEAEAWMDEHIPEDAQWWCGALVVEWRYVEDITEGMRADGLEVV